MPQLFLKWSSTYLLGHRENEITDIKHLALSLPRATPLEDVILLSSCLKVFENKKRDGIA